MRFTGADGLEELTHGRVYEVEQSSRGSKSESRKEIVLRIWRPNGTCAFVPYASLKALLNNWAPLSPEEARREAGAAHTTSDGSFSIGSQVWPGASKLVEECGELLQVLGKLVATHGAEGPWDGTNLVRRLEDELGDVLAAAYFLLDVNKDRLNEDRVRERHSSKFNTFVTWHIKQ